MPPGGGGPHPSEPPDPPQTPHRNKDFFPKWLHIIRIKDEDGGDDGWSG
eukprot:CAMPEP_0113291212 /NCGR_PEP_ID=MMETSP0008_2-20120614/33903_1 /TAXON_ID=97485 /ORGANISM="Prymnesium parvum" /LENGTH=48 /DNA_ID=CAMNT_0000143059 /DNA_START=21 /DNA_END=163 /DNA_ORIENTATION=+ /assembly_acc=CAM_ASM_000153